MSQYGDTEAAERAEMRELLPDELVELIRLVHYPTVPGDPDTLSGESMARLHLGAMAYDQALINLDGTLTTNGEETLRSLAIIEAWNRQQQHEAKL
jgi:hypothetical protein